MSVRPSKSTGRRRLMALGDYIEEKAEDRTWRKYFKMERWYSEYGDVIQKLNIQDGCSVPVNGGCGTAACMLGHGPNVPILKRAGLGTDW